MGSPGRLSLTQYLGHLRAFTDVLHAEAATVTTYVRRLEGADREHAFGWESILERARKRAPMVIERWRSFNEDLDGRIYPDDIELRAYGEHHRLRKSFPETCARVLDIIDRINRFIEQVERFDRQDAKLVSALVEELLSFVREEAIACREVGMRLMRTALEHDQDDGGPPPYTVMSRNEAGFYLEQYTAARQSFEEELRRLEGA